MGIASPLSSTFLSIPEADFDTIIGVLSRHFSSNSESFNILSNGSLNVPAILTLLCSDSPMSTVNTLLYDQLFNISVNNFFSCISRILELNLDSIVTHQSTFLNRIVELNRHYKALQMDIHKAKQPNSFIKAHGIQQLKRILDLANLLIKCRFESYHLCAEGLSFFDNSENEVFILCSILIAIGKHEEAIIFIHSQGFDRISIYGNESFCAFLAERNPAWIRQNFSNLKRLVYKNLNLLKTFFNVTSIHDFFRWHNGMNLRTQLL